MTKPIRNTRPCFHLSLPHQRGQRDVLSHTEFINAHILHVLSLPGHPLRVTRKPPTANWWVLLLALPEETSITISIVPRVKCAQRPWQGGRDSPGSIQLYVLLSPYICVVSFFILMCMYSEMIHRYVSNISCEPNIFLS